MKTKHSKQQLTTYSIKKEKVWKEGMTVARTRTRTAPVISSRSSRREICDRIQELLKDVGNHDASSSSSSCCSQFDELRRIYTKLMKDGDFQIIVIQRMMNDDDDEDDINSNEQQQQNEEEVLVHGGRSRESTNNNQQRRKTSKSMKKNNNNNGNFRLYYHHDDAVFEDHTGGGGGGINMSATERWYHFLMLQFDIFIEQLCIRIRDCCCRYGDDDNEGGDVLHVVRTLTRTFWGVLASTSNARIITSSGSSTSTSAFEEHVPEQEQDRERYRFQYRMLKMWLLAITAYRQEGSSTMNTTLLRNEFIQPYRDVQYLIMIIIEDIAKKKTNMSTIMSRELIDHEDDDDDEEESSANAVVRNNSSSSTTTLVDILMMIPMPTSQDELDQDLDSNNNNNHSNNHNNSVGGGRTLLLSSTRGRGGGGGGGSTNKQSEYNKNTTTTSSSSSSSNQKRRIRSYRTSQYACWLITSWRMALSNAWFALLSSNRMCFDGGGGGSSGMMPPMTLKKVLRYLPNHVLNNVGEPLRFTDFFMNAYDNNNNYNSNTGRSISSSSNSNNSNDNSILIPLSSLEGLYILMTRHNLEYPNFYKQLYAILSPMAFHMKYRIRFLRLLYVCIMKNDMLPAHLVAAFIKKMCRTIIIAGISPSCILHVLAIISNVLRKHPETACLIHRNGNTTTTSNNNTGQEEEEEGSTATLLLNDGYNDDTLDPEQCMALQSSSLWELNALQTHYHPSVVIMSKSIGREDELQTPMYDIERDFIGDHTTYNALFEQERKPPHGKKRRRSNNNKYNNSRSRKRSRNGTNDDDDENKEDDHDDDDDDDDDGLTLITPLTFHKPTSLFHHHDIFHGILSIPPQH